MLTGCPQRPPPQASLGSVASLVADSSTMRQVVLGHIVPVPGKPWLNLTWLVYDMAYPCHWNQDMWCQVPWELCRATLYPRLKFTHSFYLAKKRVPRRLVSGDRGRSVEVWNLSVVNQHVGGGGQVTVALLWDLETGEMFDGSPHNWAVLFRSHSARPPLWGKDWKRYPKHSLFPCIPGLETAPSEFTFMRSKTKKATFRFWYMQCTYSDGHWT